MVLPSKNGWYGLHTIPYSSNRFHGLFILPSDDLFCLSQCPERKDDYGRAGFDFCIASLLMRAVLAATSLKGDSDGIALLDVGTALGRVSFRTFRNKMVVIGKFELCQDFARLSVVKTCREQSDVLIRSQFSQFFTCVSTVSDSFRPLFLRECYVRHRPPWSVPGSHVPGADNLQNQRIYPHISAAVLWRHR